MQPGLFTSIQEAPQIIAINDCPAVVDPYQLPDILNHLDRVDTLSLDVETTGVDYVRDRLHGFRAGRLRRLLRGLERDARAAFAADERDQRHLQRDHRGCLDRRRAYGFESVQGVRLRRRDAGGGQHLRRLHRHPPHAPDVPEEEIGGR